MALGGIEASRDKNNVWVKLSSYWEHNGTKCCQVFSITKAGHYEGEEREEREDTRQRGQRRVGRESGKEEGVTSGTKRRVRKVSPR